MSLLNPPLTVPATLRQSGIAVQVTEVTRISPVTAQQGVVEDAWAAWREKSEAGLSWQLVCAWQRTSPK